jgi:hypothetical protein
MRVGFESRNLVAKQARENFYKKRLLCRIFLWLYYDCKGLLMLLINQVIIFYFTLIFNISFVENVVEKEKKLYMKFPGWVKILDLAAGLVRQNRGGT